MKQYWIEIEPVSKPRQTRSDKWKKRPAVMRYRAFADKLRSEAKRRGMAIHEQYSEVVFFLPMPASWSVAKRKKMAHTPHQQKPDIDNLLKAVFDALCEEDCHIWQIKASKYWADKGIINILNWHEDLEAA